MVMSRPVCHNEIQQEHPSATLTLWRYCEQQLYLWCDRFATPHCFYV